MQAEKRRVIITFGGTPEADGSIVFTFAGRRRRGLFVLTDLCFAAAKATLESWNVQPHKPLDATTGDPVMPTMEVDEADALRGEANFNARVQAMRSRS